ncbi:hypothetical protein DFJ74DRAFT_653902 [Hyaloraphidium curvatum]|nr:hypothetical protein DFJ74DRAFT_653902 [Hyaloraphidium curvatum]
MATLSAASPAGGGAAAPAASLAVPSDPSPTPSPLTPPADTYSEAQSELDRLKQRLISLAVSGDGSEGAEAAHSLPQDVDTLRAQISILTQDRARLETELQQITSLHDEEKRLHASAAHAVGALRKRAEDLERLLADKQSELLATQRDLQIMGEKLVDEIERRAELQHSKEAVQDELEQLTSQLFEEANVLVAKEAQKSFQMEKTSKILEEELQQTKLRLEAESQQLRELRKKMQEFMAEREQQDEALSDMINSGNGNPAVAAAVAATLGRMEPGSRNSFYSDTNDPSRKSMDSRVGAGEDGTLHPVNDGEDLQLDPVMVAEFVEFVAAMSGLRLNAIAKLPFMKTALEDDIEPTLRFGGNPQVSVKKVIEAIVDNKIFVQEVPNASAGNSPNPATGVSGPLMVQAPPPRSSSESLLSATISYAGLGGSSTGAAGRQQIREKSVWERLSGLPGVGPPNQCQACGNFTPTGGSCRFQFRLSDQDLWSPLCGVCRDRLVSTCDFYNFLRHVKSGLLQNRPTLELYHEALRLKRVMFYARNGAAFMANQERGFGRWRMKPLVAGAVRAGTPEGPRDGSPVSMQHRSAASPLNPASVAPAATQSSPLPNGPASVQQYAASASAAASQAPVKPASETAAPKPSDMPQLAMPPLNRVGS